MKSQRSIGNELQYKGKQDLIEISKKDSKYIFLI